MSTLRDLTQYLRGLSFIERDSFASEQVGESLLVSSMTEIDVFNKVFLLYREIYDGVIYIENCIHPKELILSHIMTWLIERGGRRNETDLGHPTCEPLINDDESVDLIITIRFSESVYIKEDKRGDICIDNTYYCRTQLDPAIAKELELNLP